MKHILTLAGLATCALIFLQCSQSTPISPDLIEMEPVVQTGKGKTSPGTQAEEDTLPGGGPYPARFVEEDKTVGGPSPVTLAEEDARPGGGP
ncbi:MAG TPA: hypothetical protein ENN17_11130 [bacterium]|nr:hypothetical protein [bacterium]